MIANQKLQTGRLLALSAAAAAMMLAAGPRALAGPVPSATVAPMTGVAAIPVMAEDYRLVTGDALNVSVEGHPELQGSVMILPDGTFNFPVAGRVTAAGLTIAQLTDHLAKSFSTVVNQPQVTVSVAQAHPRQISVLGAAHSTGTFDYKPGWHVLDVLAACGGPAQDPGLTSLNLVRADGGQNIPIDVQSLMTSADSDQNLTVNPGDILLFQAKDPASAEVQVIGQVGHPGIFMVPTDGISLMTLLNEAGGATPDAALTKTQIMHGGKIQTVDLHPMLNSLSDDAAAIRLVPGDVLLVPEDKQHVYLIGELHSPSIYTIPDGEGFSLLKAVTVAGGVTPNGNSKQVKIIRETPDGKDQVLTENLSDPTKTASGDIPVQAGDIVFVPPAHHSKSFTDYLNQIPGIASLAVLARTGL